MSLRASDGVRLAGWCAPGRNSAAVILLHESRGTRSDTLAYLRMLHAAATGVPLSAVIADGAGASTLGDDQLISHGLRPVFTSVTWLTMRGTELVSGGSEPTPLKQIVGLIGVPVLLIASSASGERAIDQAYRDQIGPLARVWYLPDTGHIAGLSTHPVQYAVHALAFLGKAFGARRRACVVQGTGPTGEPGCSPSTQKRCWEGRVRSTRGSEAKER